MNENNELPILAYLQIAASIALFTGLCIGFVFAVMHGLDKEAERMQAQRDYNCRYYGAAINEHTGKEVCPPTPRG